MKALPCRTPNCEGPSGMPGTARLGDGTPYLMGRAPDRFPFRVYCAACKRTSFIDAADWHRLPNLTVAQLEAAGAAPLKDLMGDKHPDGKPVWTRDQAADIFPHAAGPVALAEMLAGLNAQDEERRARAEAPKPEPPE